MMIKLQDFARQIGISDRMVQKHLNKYADELEGHIERKGQNGTWLDETAQDIIRSKMKQQPITVFEEDPRVERLQKENVELQDRLLKVFGLLERAQQKNDVLQASLDEQKLIAANVAAAEKRAAETEFALEEARDQVKTEKAVAELNAQEAAEAKQRAADLAAELERISNFSWRELRKYKRGKKHEKKRKNEEDS